jgi:hypothetical protein
MGDDLPWNRHRLATLTGNNEFTTSFCAVNLNVFLTVPVDTHLIHTILQRREERIEPALRLLTN